MHSRQDVLSEGERVRATRMRPGTPRDEFIAGRAALRQLTGFWTGTTPAEVALFVGPYGKPACNGLEFNISHSGGLLLIAASRSIPVGVDVERPHPATEMLEIAPEVFTLRELSLLHSESTDQGRRSVFGRCWSRKEATVKAHGRGLTLPLTEIEVLSSVTETTRTVLLDDGTSPAQLYTTCDLELGDGFFAALSVKGRMPQVTQYIFQEAA